LKATAKPTRCFCCSDYRIGAAGTKQVFGRQRKKYVARRTMLHSLEALLTAPRQASNENFLLLHSVGSIAHSFEIDTPIIYADYYFVEALYRYKQLLKGKEAPIK